MLTVLLAVFALLAVAWALHDGQAARDGTAGTSAEMTSPPTPLVARFIRSYSSVSGATAEDLLSAQACTANRGHVEDTREVRRGLLGSVRCALSTSLARVMERRRAPAELALVTNW